MIHPQKYDYGTLENVYQVSCIFNMQTGGYGLSNDSIDLSEIFDGDGHLMATLIEAAEIFGKHEGNWDFDGSDWTLAIESFSIDLVEFVRTRPDLFKGSNGYEIAKNKNDRNAKIGQLAQKAVGDSRGHTDAVEAAKLVAGAMDQPPNEDTEETSEVRSTFEEEGLIDSPTHDVDGDWYTDDWNSDFWIACNSL